ALINVGDSRAYMLQQGELIQLTEDHSLVEELVRDGKLTPAEAQVHPQRSIITRALGMEPAIEVDSWEIIPYTGDRILLCSDGLTNELSDERIASTLRQIADPQEAAHDLVRQARAAGGSDNITVVVVDVVDDDDRSKQASAALAGSKGNTGSTKVSAPPTVQTAQPTVEDTAMRVAAPPAPAPEPPPPSRPQLAAPPPAVPHRRFTWRVAVFVFAILAVVGTAVYAMAWYARGAYYVGIDNEQVAIFRGRPGGMLWFDPTLVERKQQPLGAELLPAQRTELEAGHEVSSKAAADRYVNNLRQEVEARRAPTTTTTLVPPSTTVPPTTSTSRP
ncbi:MAG: SpoIIE family protein phosphatase, partial [Acidimicrobiales bacterium]|nr:SpoIIE family protein phosphatase [Acidimicrobiales bacterium]